MTDIASTLAVAVKVGQAVTVLLPAIEKTVDLVEDLIPGAGNSKAKLDKAVELMKDIVNTTDQIQVDFEQLQPLVEKVINYVVFIKNKFKLWGK